MTTTRQIRIGQENIEYFLKRSKRRRKTVGLRIAHEGLEVVAPARTTIREIEEILSQRGKWILEKLTAASETPRPQPLVSGGSIPFLGGELTLVVQESAIRRPSTRSEGATLVVRVPQNLADEEKWGSVRSAVAVWYKVRMGEFLRERVTHWLPAMGREEMPKVLVREQRARWGSCSSDGTLRFSWRLGMLEPELIDSVVVHELAHLEVMNHSPAFWEVVMRAMPDARERRKRLDEAGRRIPI